MIIPVTSLKLNSISVKRSNNINSNKDTNVNKYSCISFSGLKENPKQVAFISFETVPINKTGGMADVVGELAPELNGRGYDVRVIIPLLNAQNGVLKNNDGQYIYRTPKNKEFIIEKLNLPFEYTYGVEEAQGDIYKVNDPRVKFPVYVIHCPYDVSNNKTEYQGWIMDEVRNQEAFSKASLEALKKLNNSDEDFNPKYVMSYEWTTVPIIEAMDKDEYFKNKKKITNINNFGPVYQGRVGAPVVAPYILTKEELKKHCSEPRVKSLLREINMAVEARAGSNNPLSIKEYIDKSEYERAYIKISKNYEKYIPYTTNHIGFLDKFLIESFPDKGWFNGYYNFYVPALRKTDAIVTCADTYLKELQREDRYSGGVANIMNMQALKSYGNTIGLDYSLYNPSASEQETAKPIKYPFSVDINELTKNNMLYDFRQGKELNKKYIQTILSKSCDNTTNKIVGANQYGYLDKDKKAFLSTFITRFDPQQKGLDILIDSMKKFLKKEPDAQIIIAGPDYNPECALIKSFIDEVVKKYPGRAVLLDGFINNVAQFYASSDAILIPSRFAPFELVQLQGMRMGAVPIASNAGGLSEIIKQEGEVATKEILGFKTKESLYLSKDPVKDFYETTKRAINLYHNNPELWNTMVANCLRYKRDWSKPTDAYVDTVFNPLNYCNIKDMFYIDKHFAAGSISLNKNKKLQEEDMQFLKHKKVKRIIDINTYNEQLEKLAKKYGMEYSYLKLSNVPTEEEIYTIFKLLTSEDGLNFVNEKQNKYMKSVLAALYMAYKDDNKNTAEILDKVFTQRGQNYRKIVPGKILEELQNVIEKLMRLGENNSHDFNLLNLDILKTDCWYDNYEALEYRRKRQEINDLILMTKDVYAGRYYLK